MSEVFFLRSELPTGSEFGGYRWSLQVVKVSALVPSAYVAFSSRELAQRYAEGRENLSVVSATELDSSHFADFDNKHLVFFSSAEAVDRCLSDRGGFPYEQHIAAYSTKHGLVSHAA